MGLFDGNMLGPLQQVNQQMGPMVGLTQANQVQQMMEQQKTAREQQGADDAFNQAAQSGDMTHEADFKAALSKMVMQGYGKQAMSLFGEYQKNFPQPKPKEFTSVPTSLGDVPFDTQRGTYGQPAVDAQGNPYFSPEVAKQQGITKADNAFAASIPTYQKQLKGMGADTNKRDLLASQIIQDHPNSPKAERYITDVLKTQTALSAQPPSKASTDSWAQGLANKSRGLDDLYKAASGIRGPAKQKFIDDAINGATAIDPSFSPVQARIGLKQAEDVSNQKTLGMIQGVLPNMQKLIGISDKISRSGIKLFSRAEMAASRQFSDEDLANFDALKTLTADEINQIFAGGKGGSDKSRDMALSLVNETLPAKQFASVASTVYTAMQNRAKGISSTFRGYGVTPASNGGDKAPIGHGGWTPADEARFNELSKAKK